MLVGRISEDQAFSLSFRMRLCAVFGTQQRVIMHHYPPLSLLCLFCFASVAMR